MRIAHISAANSVHTARWINAFSASGFEVHLISAHTSAHDFDSRVNFHTLNHKAPFAYLASVLETRRLLNFIKPDLVNAHYATGYGLLARLVGFKPTLLSVWGSDVYDFPYKSSIHRRVLISNLMAADAVASTSHCMAEQTKRLAPKLGDIAITPFGVDCSQFTPLLKPSSVHDVPQAERPIVIGTVKTLAHTYGIDVLIRAFALARRAIAQEDEKLATRLRLRIVGDGPDEAALKKLAQEQQISDAAVFVGNVQHARVPDELRQLDIFAAFSRKESFGVAVLEAGAVGLPVVVSDAEGLAEVVLHGQTGLVVSKENAQAGADALVRLILYPELRQQLGSAGRAHVLANYSWDASLKTMLTVYESVIAAHKLKTLSMS